MKFYKSFVIAFAVSIVAIILFFVAHFQMMFTLMNTAETMNAQTPAEVFGLIFTPLWIASFVFLIISTITYQVLGIVMIIKNPNVEGTDRILWILGFILAGFITAIVFMILLKSKNLTATEYIPKNNPWDRGIFNPDQKF